MKSLTEHFRDKVYVISGLLSIENARNAVINWLEDQRVEAERTKDGEAWKVYTKHIRELKNQ